MEGFPQLVEQTRVLDGNDRLGSKILDQRDLLVAEGSNLLAIDDDSAGQLLLLEHRHCEKGSRARQFDKSDQEVIAFAVSRLRREVVNVDYLSRSGDASERDIRMIAYVNYRLALPEFRVGRRPVPCDCAKRILFAKEQIAALGLADTSRVF